MYRSGFFRRIVGGLLALGVLAALVSPTAASPIVRKTPRVIVDAASGATAAPALLRTGDGTSTPLWIVEPAGSDSDLAQFVSFYTDTRRTRARDLLEHSAFGSRPPPGHNS